jgi:hypothetical protein
VAGGRRRGVGGRIAGTWRPRKTGQRLTVHLQPWGDLPGAVRAAIGEQAERLAACRGVALAGVDVSGSAVPVTG